MTNCEAVQRTMENINKIVAEFREADMKKKLKECQGLRTQVYQHLESYIEEDKVWYQPMNGYSWLGPVAVLFQRGQSVWLHTSGDIKMVAACKVKPYELVERKKNKENKVSNRIMLGDGLKM